MDSTAADMERQRYQDRMKVVFLLLIVAYVLYAEVFILRTSFNIDGEQFFCLYDDAMISMRYAKNFASGHGLVWNPGEEPVEGYTNPLWVCLMSFFHLLPIAPSKICLFVQLSSLAVLCLNLMVVKKISERFSGYSVGAVACSLIFTAFYFPLNKWSLLGMETGAATLFVSMAFYQIFMSLQGGRFSLWCYLTMGVGTFVRIDMFSLYLFAVVFLAVSDRSNRSRHLLWGLGLMLVFLVFQSCLRLWYYHDWLPNTYYLKMTGFPVVLRIAKGLYSAFQFVYGMNILLFLLPFGILFFRRDAITVFALGLIFLQIAYSIYTGGDIADAPGHGNRFVCVVMPIFFILFSHVLMKLFQAIRTAYPHMRKPMRWATIPAVVICLIRFNAGPQLQHLDEWLVVKRMGLISANNILVEAADHLKHITKPGAAVAVVWAGVLPYFLDRPVVDLLGKNDRKIARQEVDLKKLLSVAGVSKYQVFVPGHTKWDYLYSIGRLQPDIVFQLYPDKKLRPTPAALADASPFLKERYAKSHFLGFVFFIDRKSRNVRWEHLETVQDDSWQKAS